MAEQKLTKAELEAKAAQPGIDAMKMHPYYIGKVEVVPKCIVRDFNDFAIWYTPGVAKPCLDIKNNPETVFEEEVLARQEGEAGAASEADKSGA